MSRSYVRRKPYDRKQNLDKGAYLPTAEAIEVACQEIQVGWTPEELARRLVYRPPAWTPPRMTRFRKLRR